jgi:glutamate/tyrosine decarboxylase-like PLP-dependent enzyme
MQLPSSGMPLDALVARMRERKAHDADWRGGRTWSLVYPAGEDVDAVLRAAHELYLHENALNPRRFPSVRAMEEEVVSMTAGLLRAGPGAAGAMTSGGTESILLAVKTARERGRVERGVSRPRMVVPWSAHPAFAKAAQILGIELVQVPLDDAHRARVDAAAELVDDDTVLVVGSAPCYPFGVVDPIPELAALAASRGIAFHTDACLGGFMLPFLERLGEPVPPWDFRVPGVSTISSDVHKYGYATKGASVIVHRDGRHLREHQLFLWERWPGGLYGSFAMAGARAASPIAAAWAVMNHLGEEGFLRLARSVRDTTRRLREGIAAIPPLAVLGEPVMGVFAFGSDAIDAAAVCAAMDARGWHLDRQQGPDALHLMVSPIHARVVEPFLADLREAVAHPAAGGDAPARYA